MKYLNSKSTTQVIAKYTKTNKRPYNKETWVGDRNQTHASKEKLKTKSEEKYKLK